MQTHAWMTKLCSVWELDSCRCYIRALGYLCAQHILHRGKFCYKVRFICVLTVFIENNPICPLFYVVTDWIDHMATLLRRQLCIVCSYYFDMQLTAQSWLVFHFCFMCIYWYLLTTVSSFTDKTTFNVAFFLFKYMVCRWPNLCQY